MSGNNFVEGKSPDGTDRPTTPEGRLLYALKFGLSRKKAREWAGLSKDGLKALRAQNPSLAPQMQVAIADGDVYLLEQLFKDTHWQAWRLILEYRDGLGKKRLVSTESEPGGNHQDLADDPMAMNLAAQLAQVPPGKEHLMRIVIDDPADAGQQATDVTHAQNVRDLKA
jgi:hypothetical protein